MPIIIKDLVSSDIVGASGSFMNLIDKINFNFDQIIINGGGPIGLPGPKGDIGLPGPAGGRGNFWFAGSTPPMHGDNNEVLIDGDKFIGIDGFIKSYSGSSWIVTSVNLMGATGNTGATGKNGYSGGYEVYQGYPNLGYGITLSGGVALGSTGLTGESSSYPNFITTTNHRNTILVGDQLWSMNNFKNFGVVYARGNYFGVGTGISTPKLVLVQETVEDSSNFLLSFGAYGLTAGAISNASYGFNTLGGTADFLDFINIGFKNMPIVGGSNYGTHFKVISNTIPVDIEVGAFNPTPSKKPADFNLTANNIFLNTWGGTINLTSDTTITGSISATVMSSFPGGINVGTAINSSVNNNFVKISNELDNTRLALYVSSDKGDNDAIQAVANGNGVTIRAISTGINGTAIKAEGKTNLDGTLFVSGLSTFSAGLNSSGGIFTGSPLYSGYSAIFMAAAAFNAGLTASSVFIAGTSTYNGLATFNSGFVTSSATFTGTSIHNGLASFNSGLNASSATFNGISTFNGNATFNSGLTATAVNVGTGRIKQNGSEIAPKGEIIMWYGNTLASIPYGYVFCGKWYVGFSSQYDTNGDSINAGPLGTTSYAAVKADLDTYFNNLYGQSLTLSNDAIGNLIFWYITFSGNTILGITIPDLSGLFLPQSGYRGGLPNYHSGDTGGLDSVKLTSAQSGLVDHTHNVTIVGENNGYTYVGNGSSSGTLYSGAHPITTNGVNGGAQDAYESHENRPPFKTVTYLIRVV
jgi:hypothetical protein